MRSSNRTPYLIALLVSLVLFLFFAYQSYTSYRSYKIAQSSDKYISFLYRCDNLLKSIESERLLSANYIGKDGKSDFSIIEKSRKSTDNFLTKANIFADTRPDFSKDLQYVRSRVDIISDDHNSIFFKYYQDELATPIIKQLELYTQELAFGISDIKNRLLRYKELIIYRDNLNQKDSFISYILSKQEKLGPVDLEILDTYIKDIKPPKNFNTKDNTDAKIKVIQGATVGVYNISQKEWQAENSLISNRADSLKKELFLEIQSTIKKVGAEPKALIYYLLGALVFLVLSLLFMRKFIDSKARKIIKSSMADIKKDTSKHQLKPQSIVRESIVVEQDVSDDIVLKYNSVDIPLTNGVEKQKVELKKTTIRSFDPMQTFTSLVGYFIQECDIKDIGFKYKIDPDIPTRGIGNVSKIDEVFKLFVEYILDSTTSEDMIIFDIENIAQTKADSAIKLSLFRNSDTVKTDKSINLTKMKSILSQIDGNFEVEETQEGRVFHITINIKRN